MQVKGGIIWQKMRKQIIQPKEQLQHQKADGILTQNINKKTFVTEIYFNKKSRDTFQDKLLKIVQAERKE